MAKHKLSRCDFIYTEKHSDSIDDKFTFHEIKGYRITNLPIDWIELVIHRNPLYPKLRKWLVSEVNNWV